MQAASLPITCHNTKLGSYLPQYKPRTYLAAPCRPAAAAATAVSAADRPPFTRAGGVQRGRGRGVKTWADGRAQGLASLLW